jgi:hypothetical protein
MRWNLESTNEKDDKSGFNVSIFTILNLIHVGTYVDNISYLGYNACY